MAKKGRTKGNKICAAGISWAKEHLINTHLPMQIWRQVNIVKILITEKVKKRNKDE